MLVVPGPLYTIGPELDEPDPVAVADVVEEVVVALILVGFCAPHGWS